MSIIYNGTTVTAVSFNGTNLSKVIYGTTTVFEEIKDLVLFNGGQTGYGWYSYGYAIISGWSARAATIGSYISMKGGGGSSAVITSVTINPTGYNKVNANYTYSQYGSYVRNLFCRFGFRSSNSGYYESTFSGNYCSENGGSISYGSGTLSFINTLSSGSYYLLIGIHDYGTLQISKIWLSK